MKRMKQVASWLLTLSLLLSLFTLPGFAVESESENGGSNSESSGGSSEDSGSGEPSAPVAVYVCTFKMTSAQVLDPMDTYTYESGVEIKKDGLTIGSEKISQSWSVADESVATIESVPDKPGSCKITAKAAGVTEITVTVKMTDGDVVKTYSESQIVTVSGIVLDKSSMELLEGERAELPSYKLYGKAEGKLVTWSSSNGEVARASRDMYVDAWTTGKTELTAKVDGTDYATKMSVTVRANEANSINRTLMPGGTLSFSSIDTEIAGHCRTLTGSALSHVTGLSVSTNQGILFEKYKSEDEPGRGVAQSGSYYVSSSAVGPYLSDITFVPNAYFTGDTVQCFAYTFRSYDLHTCPPCNLLRFQRIFF